MADYKVLIDGLIDTLIKSDKAVMKYGGIAMKEGISFIENGGVEKISNGIDSVKDIFGTIKGAAYTMKRVAEDSVHSGNNIEKSIGIANQLIGTLTPIITSAGPAITTSVSPIGLAAAIGGNISKVISSSKTEKNNIKSMEDGLNNNMIGLSSQVTDLSGIMLKMRSLSWVSAGASVLNCGISVAGFALVLKQLNNIQKGIESIEAKLDKTLIDRAEKVFHDLMHYMQKLSDLRFNMDSEDNLVQKLNEASQLIWELTEMAGMDGRLEASMVLQLLLPLNVTFEKVVKEYSIKAFYNNHAWPVNLNSWEETLNNINQAQICEDINFYMHLEYPEYTEKELAVCMKYIKDDLLQVPALEIKQSREFIEQTGMTKDEYYDLPNEIMRRINSENYETITSRTLSEVYNM